MERQKHGKTKNRKDKKRKDKKTEVHKDRNTKNQEQIKSIKQHFSEKIYINDVKGSLKRRID